MPLPGGPELKFTLFPNSGFPVKLPLPLGRWAARVDYLSSRENHLSASSAATDNKSPIALGETTHLNNI